MPSSYSDTQPSRPQNKQPKPTLVLASASPRRKELLESMGCEFTVQAADIDETRLAGETPGDYVSRLAQEKAHAAVSYIVSSNANKLDGAAPHQPAVLAADTIVAQGDTVFGKPAGKAQAFEMWRALASSEHTVMTAICLVHCAKVRLELVQSTVQFGPIDEAQMARYWQTGEPRDKAGAYAIQGLASAWVQLLNGSYSNVVGLPLRETNQLLKTVGHDWL